MKRTRFFAFFFVFECLCVTLGFMIDSKFNFSSLDEFERLKNALHVVASLGLGADNSVVVGRSSLYLQDLLSRDEVKYSSDLDVLVIDKDIFSKIRGRWKETFGVVLGGDGSVVRLDIGDRVLIQIL